jgi:hypothetical protein
MSSPIPQHGSPVSELAFLLAHPPTPLYEVLPEGLALPAPEPPPRSRKYIKGETLALYARVFRELPPPVTATRLALHLSFRVSSVLKILRVLQSYGYVKPSGTKKVHGQRPAMIWTWTGPAAQPGVPYPQMLKNTC